MTLRFRCELRTADGVRRYFRVDRVAQEIYRICLKNMKGGEEDPTTVNLMATERRYILWTRKPNGTYVYREDL